MKIIVWVYERERGERVRETYQGLPTNLREREEEMRRQWTQNETDEGEGRTRGCWSVGRRGKGRK